MIRTMPRAVKLFALLLAAALLLLAVVIWQLNVRDETSLSPTPAAPSTQASPELVQRGAYLARAGNCMACHTARGGAPYAGGRGIDTPFGTIFTSNLTPDPATGIGAWSADEFWRALHNGRGKSGRLLYPAFPYTNYTRIPRADADALYAYLRSLPAVQQPNPAHELRFPYNTQAALAVWRALFFTPGVQQPESTESAAWNRGAYLVQGLGHCSACHAARNSWGASGLELDGGLIPMQGWYAPSLNDTQEAGVASWDTRHIVALLKTGVAPQASVSGPMAEVVQASTQYLDDIDLEAMATYLKALPQVHRTPARPAPRPAPDTQKLGAEIYDQHCAACHGEQGRGVPGIYPGLAGNRAVTLEPGVNLVRMVLKGGFAPSTAGNPRPFGMPPFAIALSDEEIAAVATFVRRQWGNQASGVTAFDVSKARGKRAD